MLIQSIHAVTDFSMQAEHAVERAARLAVQHRAALHLVYFAAEGTRSPANPLLRLDQRARQLAGAQGIRVTALSRQPVDVADLLFATREADLTVIDPRSAATQWKFWQGSATEAVLRGSRCPVLVVRRAPLENYRRMVLAIGPERDARALVRCAEQLDADAAIDLFQTVCDVSEAELRMARVPPAVQEIMDENARRSARSRLFRVCDAFSTRRSRVASFGQRGDPARQLAWHQQAVRADVLIVGKERSSALRDFWRGSVVQRLLGWVEADVLVVPHDWRVPSRNMARARIRAAAAADPSQPFRTARAGSWMSAGWSAR